MTSLISPSTSDRKSTTGRSVPPDIRALRLWFRLVAAVAPRVAERQAAALFLTPRRRPAAHRRLVPHGARRVRLAADGFDLRGWEWGIGPKPVVLLVHGWSGLAADMATLAEALVGEGYRAVAFDMPAHGGSPGRRTTLVEWVRALGAIERWAGGLEALVGHSFGAAAVTFALEEGVRARRAVLVAPAAGPLHFVGRTSRFIGLPEARVPGMIGELEARVGRAMAHFEPVRAARELRTPALVLHDPADGEVPWEGVQRLAEAWPGSRLEVLGGLGHFRILRDLGAAARAASFVAEPDAAASPGAQSAMSGR